MKKFLFFLYFSTFYASSDNQLQELQNNCTQFPDSIEHWIKLGVFFLKKHNPFDALDAYKKALALDEHNVNTWFHIANCFLVNDEPLKAIEIYEAILQQNHSQAMVWHNLGYAYKKINSPQKALHAFSYALRYNLSDAGNHLSYGLMQLTCGNYQIGFQEYEWRWTTALKKIIFEKIPLWDGSDLCGKTLLVTAEQGFGDSFQCMRYLKMLHRQGVTIIFRAQPAIMKLAQECPYLDQVLSKEEFFAGHADAHIPLMSIPFVLKTEISSIPQEGKYLATKQEQDNYWAEKIRYEKGYKIAFCLQGNDLFATANFETTLTRKSIPWEIFAPLFDIPHIQWYCIAKNQTRPDFLTEHTNITFFDADFDSAHGAFVDSASIIQSVDLVITVDTAIAHLAGGLGVKTIVLLPYVADWRWLLDRSDSPWYPSLMLLRQTLLNDWTTVIKPLHDILMYQNPFLNKGSES